MKKKEKQSVIEATKELGENVEKKSRAFWTDFKKFAVKGNIIDLAIAVVIGTAFNKIVSSLVSCIITPLTSMLIPGGDLASLKWVLKPAIEANEEAGIEEVAEVAVTYGEFLQNAIDFFVIALTMYVVLKVYMKLKEAFRNREKAAAEERARELAQKKKEEAEAAAAAEQERQDKLRHDFLEDVSIQADTLTEVRDILLRFEKKLGSEDVLHTSGQIDK